MARRGGEQFNINIYKLWDMLSSLKLMGKRREMESGLIEERMTGYRQLEEERHENRMAQINEYFLNALAQDDEVKQLQGLAFKQRIKGESVDKKTSDRLEKVLTDRALFLLYNYKKRVPTEAEVDIIKSLNPAWVGKLIGEIPATERKIMEIERVEEPKLILRKYESRTGRMGARTRNQELELDRLKFNLQKTKTKDEYYKLIHSNKIAPLQSFLQKFTKEGVSGIGQLLLSFAGIEQKEKAETLLGGAVTRENLYKLIKQVDILDTKAMKQKLNDDELAWLSDAYDLFLQQTIAEGIPEAEVPEDARRGTNPTGEQVALINGRWLLIKKK